MAVTSEVSFANLLAMIILLLIHPHLASTFKTALWLAPSEIFTLTWTRVVAAVVEPFVGPAEMLRISSRVFFELIVPDEIRAAVAGGFRDVATSCMSRIRVSHVQNQRYCSFTMYREQPEDQRGARGSVNDKVMTVRWNEIDSHEFVEKQERTQNFMVPQLSWPN